MVKMIRMCDGAYLREQYNKGELMRTYEGIGQPEIVIGTGRATCRICGEKIVKGEKSIKFSYDDEGNAWIALEIQIHLKDCQPPKI